MNINFDDIKKQLALAYEFVVEQGGLLAHHTIKVIKQGLEAIRQDQRLTCATFAVSNIIFFETSLHIATFADNLLLKLSTKEEKEWGGNALLAKSIVLLTFMCIQMGGMNYALSKALRSNFSSMEIVGISTASCAGYILFRLWMSDRKE